MRRAFSYCMLDPDYRSKYFIGMGAAVAYTAAAAVIIVMGYSGPSKAAGPEQAFDQAIMSWNRACQDQVWPYLDDKCMKGAKVGTVRVIGGPRLPSEFYRDAEGLEPSKAGKPCAHAGKSCVTSVPARRGDRV